MKNDHNSQTVTMNAHQMLLMILFVSILTFMVWGCGNETEIEEGELIGTLTSGSEIRRATLTPTPIPDLSTVIEVDEILFECDLLNREYETGRERRGEWYGRARVRDFMRDVARDQGNFKVNYSSDDAKLALDACG